MADDIIGGLPDGKQQRLVDFGDGTYGLLTAVQVQGGISATSSPQTASALGANPPEAVAASTTTAPVVAANAARKGGSLKCRAGGVETFVCLATTATVATAALSLDGGQNWDFMLGPVLWRGPVSVITAAGVANLIFSEV